MIFDGKVIFHGKVISGGKVAFSVSPPPPSQNTSRTNGLVDVLRFWDAQKRISEKKVISGGKSHFGAKSDPWSKNHYFPLCSPPPSLNTIKTNGSVCVL